MHPGAAIGQQLDQPFGGLQQVAERYPVREQRPVGTHQDATTGLKLLLCRKT